MNLFMPVFRFSNKAIYTFPRRAAVFEKALLDIVAQFSADEDYGNMSIETVFEEILHVPEAQQFVGPSLEKLIRQEMLECRKAYNSLAEIQVQDLQLSELGERLQERGFMTGTEKEHAVEHFVDVLANELLSLDEQESLMQEEMGKCVHVAADDYFNEDLILQDLRSERPEWLPENGEIINVVFGEARPLWRNVSGSLEIGDDGDISIDFGVDGYNRYFSDLDAEELYQRFLAGLFFDKASEEAIEGYRAIRFNELPAKPEALFLPQEMIRQIDPEVGNIHFLRYRPEWEHLLEPRPDTLTVVFEFLPEDAPDGIRWNPEKNSAIIFLDERFPIDGCHYLNDRKDNAFLRPFNLVLNNDACRLPLGYRLPKDAREIYLPELYDLIEEIIDQSEDQEHQLIKLFWKPAPDVLEDIRQMLEAQIPSVLERQAALRGFYDKIRLMKPGVEM